MFFVRFLVLALLVAFSYGMGTQRVPLNAFGTFVAASFFIVAPALYLLPTYEAWRNKHPNLTSIALVNIFLGWSILGWIVAVVWAFKKPEPVAVTIASAPPAPSPSYVPPPQPRHTKRCPFCAEDVLAEAIKCKHCGSDLAKAT